MGVLQAVEARGLEVDAIVGTSSGALIGALWAAGHRGADLEALVADRRPLSLMRANPAFWQGAFRLDPLIGWLRELLPPTIEDLGRPFAAGVMGPDGKAALLREGPLPEAVAASCAIPYLFVSVRHQDVPWRDGGVVDRLMLDPWRAWRGERRALVHLVDRTGGKDPDGPIEPWCLVRTPRSGATFWSLGDVPAAVAQARACAEAALATAPIATTA